MKRLKGILTFQLIFLLFVSALSGCSSGGSYEQSAKDILKKLLPCSLEQAAELNGKLVDDNELAKAGLKTAGTETEKYIKKNYSDVLTEECIKKTTANRALFASKTLAEDYGEDITVGKIELYGDISNDLLFYYNAELLADGKKVAVADGAVCLSEKDKNKANSFSVSINQE